MSDAVLLALIGTIQAISTALIGLLVKRNACGGARCMKMIDHALASSKASSVLVDNK